MYGQAQNNTAAITAYTQEPATVAPELKSVDNDLNALLSGLWEHANKIERALDRLQGPRPKAVDGAGKPATEPSNILSSLRNRIEGLNALSGSLLDSAHRLESIA